MYKYVHTSITIYVPNIGAEKWLWKFSAANIIILYINTNNTPHGDEKKNRRKNLSNNFPSLLYLDVFSRCTWFMGEKYTKDKQYIIFLQLFIIYVAGSFIYCYTCVVYMEGPTICASVPHLYPFYRFIGTDRL